MAIIRGIRRKRALEVSETFNVTGDDIHAQIIIDNPSMVFVDFPQPDEIDADPKLVNQGRFIIIEAGGSQYEIMGPVKELAPMLRSIADAFGRQARTLP